MELTIDFYFKHSSSKTEIIELPDDTVFCKIPWSEFGKVLNKYRKDNMLNDDYTPDMYCYDVYCYTNTVFDINEDEELFDDLCCGQYDAVKIGNGTLIRFYHCDIIDFDNYITLDDFNSKIDFSNEYYEYYKDPKIPDELLKNYISEGGSFINPDAFNQLYSELLKQSVLSYFKIIKLDETGAYIREAKIKDSLTNMESNNILHDSIEISELKYKDFEHTHISYKGIDLKDNFDKRIQEIINI